MQFELSKSEDVKFSSFRPSAFQKYFAFYGLIRTDTAILLIDFLNLPIRCVYSDFQKILNSHFVWQQGWTSSVFQGKYRYLVDADAFAEGIDCIILLFLDTIIDY